MTAAKNPEPIYVVTWVGDDAPATLFTAEELADWSANIRDFDAINFVQKWAWHGEGWEAE